MDYFEKGSPVRQHVTQEVHNDVSFLRKVQAKNLNVENFSTSTPVPVYRGLDIDSLFNAVMADSASADDWKASFTIEFPAEGAVVNGQFETNGDFLTEESTSNIVGILKDTEEGEDAKTTIIASSKFKPTSGTTLNGIEISAAGNVYDFDNFTWKYKYEENPTATGSDPMYLHDFTFSVDSTQINGYVLIGADDSVIAANIDGFMPSAGGGGGSCDAALNFNIGLSSFDANSNMIGVDTFTGNNFSGALEIRSVEGSPVATSFSGPAQNLDFFMPVIDQSASDDYEYILTLMDENTGCTYCAIGSPITLVLNDPQQSQTANNDLSGMGCGSLFAASPAAPK
jgi:hypothetical protein